MADNMELRIAKLELSSGDVLVVQADRQPVHDVFRSLVPAGVKVLYIPIGVNLSVMTKAEIESRAH